MGSFRDAKLLVVVFMSNRCPGVKAYDTRLARLQREFSPKGVQFVGVNPIDESLYPTESLTEMATAARERNLDFPYLKDASQDMARRFGAVCTPHTFVLDEARTIQYAGKIDDAFLPANVNQDYIRDALGDLLEGKAPALKSTMPLGCAIDWSHQSSPAFSQVTPRSAPVVAHH